MDVLDFRCFLKEDGRLDSDLHGDWQILFPSAVKHQEGTISQTRRRGIEIDNGLKLSKCMESVLLSLLESLPPRLVPHTLRFREAALQRLLTHLLSPRLLQPVKENLLGCSSSLTTLNT